ncbi:hypothetical protein VH1807_contig00024-0043 [Vibrio harveyi]|uniref:helix-turn-helix domain-containing protein n=1 Tax=Vibrio harveyi TaxID=669 RepID=UPI0010FFAC1D|nr:helix-turn-helix domain-containing protein [Vibrio harveyi]GEA22325.1 hypothetical protein VH1807_contig00024-0043 [Vibrio harveyi]
MPPKKKKLSIVLNKTEAAEYFGVSRNTVNKAVNQYKLQPVSKKGNTEYFELRDLAEVLITPKKKVRADRDTMSADQKRHVQSVLALFDSMGEYAKFELAEATKQKRKLAAGRLMEGETVIATIGATIAAVRKVMQKVPNVAESVCSAFTREHAEKLDERLKGEVNALLLDAEGIIEDAKQRLHDGGSGDS